MVKPARGRDVYVLWSTFTDSPVFFGTRERVFAELGGDVRPGVCPTCRGWVSESHTPSAQLRCADEWGASARRFGWDAEWFFYRMTGMLARRDLVRAVELAAEGRAGEVLDLLQPYEDAPELLAGALAERDAERESEGVVGGG